MENCTRGIYKSNRLLKERTLSYVIVTCEVVGEGSNFPLKNYEIIILYPAVEEFPQTRGLLLLPLCQKPITKKQFLMSHFKNHAAHLF